MPRKLLTICVLLFLCVIFLPHISSASINWRVNARSAILIDMERGAVLYEQNADTLIAPASITKILTLYLVFEAIKEGQVRLSDMVEVSSRAASTGGSRMGLRAHTRVPLEELIKGMAVVSGNDACVAAAEHISGSVDRFVRKMNVKARELGMTNSRFMTPNGLPANGQVTTARDISKLSIAYLRRFPESLTIHSMTAYSYGKSSHHNANRLLGKCPGVDGLKTGFVCASGYNISATAKRSGVRVLAVVMGARSPWVRCSEAERLIEVAFREAGAPYNELRCSISPAPARGRTLASGGKNSVRASVKKAKLQNREAGVNRNQMAAAGITKGRASGNIVMAEKKQAKTSTPLVRKGKVSAKEKKRVQIAAKHNKTKQTATVSKASKVKSAAVKPTRSTAKTVAEKKLRSTKSKKEEPRASSKKNSAVPHARALKKQNAG